MLLAPLSTATAALAAPLQPAVPVVHDAVAAPVVVAAATTAPRPAYVTVRRGDTLSKVSARVCGTSFDWSGLYRENRAKLPGGPDSLLVGIVLKVHCYDPGYTYPKPKLPKIVHVQTAVHAVAHATVPVVHTSAQQPVENVPSYGVLTASQVGSLWLEAGGPAWAEGHAEEIAYCESGYRTNAYNPSGATGLWQILGSVVGGNLDNPLVNAENAVAKFKASGDTFAQWVCT